MNLRFYVRTLLTAESCVFFSQWALEGNAPALAAHSGNLSKRDDGGATPLHYASSKGHIRVINLIVQISGSQGEITSSLRGNKHLCGQVATTRSAKELIGYVNFTVELRSRNYPECIVI